MASSSSSSSSSLLQSPSQRVRQLWRTFEQWQAPRRTAMHTQRKHLAPTNPTRIDLESKFFAAARKEWHKRLSSVGLKDEDWGDMSPAETRAVEDALGASSDSDEQRSHPESSNDDASDPQAVVDNSLSLVPVPHTLQAPTQILPSLSTSSLASSLSSYELVNPCDLVSDDDRDDDDAAGFFFNMAVTRDLPSASASDDEGLPLAVPFTNGSGALLNTNQQWRPYEQPSYQHWSSDSLITSSSRHPSANASPSQPPAKSFVSSALSKTVTTAFKPQQHQQASSPWAAPASMVSSMTSSAYTAVSTSLFGTSPQDPTPGLTSASTSRKPKAAAPPQISASASASAAASAASIKPASSASPASSSSSSKLGRYVGPSLHDPEDTQAEEMEFEKFKMTTRIAKIIEFHRAAAELDVKLAVEICRRRWEQGSPAMNGRDKVADRLLVEQHEKEMRLLQEAKEAERKKAVKEERKRRRLALSTATTTTAKSTGQAGTAWLDAYTKNAQVEFEAAIPMPGGFLEEADPYTQQPQQQQVQFTTFSPQQQSYQLQEQLYPNKHYSPPLFSPIESAPSSSTSSSNNASPASFWDVGPGGHHQQSAQYGRPQPVDSPEMFKIARPQPMPAWNPAQLMDGVGAVDGGLEEGEEQEDEDEDRRYAYPQQQHEEFYRRYEPPRSDVYEEYDDGYKSGHGSASEFFDFGARGDSGEVEFGGGEEDVPEELRAAMSGFGYMPQQQQQHPQQHSLSQMYEQEYEHDPRQPLDNHARRLGRDNDDTTTTPRIASQTQQQQQTKAWGIKSKSSSNSNGTSNMATSPTSATSSSSGVLNKTPTTTSPLANLLQQGSRGLMSGMGSLNPFAGGWGAKEGETAREGTEHEPEREEEREKGWRQPPAQPTKKAAPAPAPAPAPMTAKARKAAALAAKAEAAAQAQAEAQALLAAKKAQEEAEAAAAAAREAQARVEEAVRVQALEAKARAKTAAASPTPKDWDVKPTPPPGPTAAAGKKQTKKQRLAALKEKKGGKGEEKKEEKESEETGGKESLSASGVWGEMSSTPKPAAASLNVKSGWGVKAPTVPTPAQEVLQQQGTPRMAGMLRKQVVVSQQQASIDKEKGAEKALMIDDAPLPADVRESLWSRAASTRPVPTPVQQPTPVQTSVSNGPYWKANGGGRGRRNSDPVSPTSRTLDLPPHDLYTPQMNGGALSKKIATGGNKRRNGGAPSKTVTIEEVSDEEDGVLDGSLPLGSRYLLEPSHLQQPIQQPRPSVPPTSFNNLFEYDHNHHRQQQQHETMMMQDDSFDSSYQSSLSMTPSTAPTSPSSDGGPPNAMSNEEFFSAATKQLRQGPHPSRTGYQQHDVNAGFASDWDATVKAKRPRWNTTASTMGRPASTMTSSSSSSSSSSQAALRYKAGLVSAPAMAASSSSESDDLSLGGGGAGAGMMSIPGGFPGGGGGGGGARGGPAAPSMWEAQKQRAAAGNGGGGRMSSSSTAGGLNSGWGDPAISVDAAGEDEGSSDALARFAKAQRLETLKRNKMAANGSGKLF